MSKQPLKVIVEGTIFDSISAAARYLNVNSASVWAAAHGSGRLKNLAIKFEHPELSQALSLERGYQSAKRKAKRKGCPVICETLNKKFKSIREASVYAKVNDWTMSKKMETAGQFIDNEGNVYKRILPMDTKNVYVNTGDTLQKIHNVKHRRINKEPVIESKPTVMEVNPVSVLQNEAINHIQNGDYIKAEMFIAALKLIANKQ